MMPVMDISHANSRSATGAKGSGHADAPDLRLFVFALFFIFGGITSLNDVVIPKLKGLFALKYGEVMLVQSAFFVAYFVISLPAAAIVRRIGYMRAAVLGLLMMTAGCLLFIPASSSGIFGCISRSAVRAGGRNHRRSSGGQSADLHARAARRRRTADSLSRRHSIRSAPPSFPMSARSSSWVRSPTVDPSQLAAAALAAFRAQETPGHRAHLPGSRRGAGAGGRRGVDAPQSIAGGRRTRTIRCWVIRLPCLRQRRFGFGALCIFLYVGAEVAIGSLIVNYLMQSNVLGLSRRGCGQARAVLLGRRHGRAVYRRLSAAHLLARQSAGVRRAQG